MSANWYVAVTHPGREMRARMEVDALGYRTFLPTMRKWITHARVKKTVHRPLLARYMFVEVGDGEFWRIAESPSISNLISSERGPAVVPSMFVEQFLHRFMRGEWDFVAADKLPVGARIKVVAGEFDEMLATITQVKGHQISAKLLGTNQYIKLHDSSVRAAA
jgi:transcription antitermination factor NusG